MRNRDHMVRMMSFRISESLFGRLVKHAEEERRSVSAFVCNLLEDFVNEYDRLDQKSRELAGNKGTGKRDMASAGGTGSRVGKAGSKVDAPPAA